MVRSAASTAIAVASVARSATLWDVATKLASARFIVWDQTRSGTIATVPVAVDIHLPLALATPVCRKKLAVGEFSALNCEKDYLVGFPFGTGLLDRLTRYSEEASAHSTGKPAIP